MSWKYAGAMLAVITLANVAGVLWSQAAKLWVWGLLILGTIAVVYFASWRRRRRTRALERSPVQERASRRLSLDEEEQALTRLALDMVTPDQIWRLPIEGRVFGYERTPLALHSLIFWGCALVSALPLIQIISDPGTLAQDLPALCVGIGFALGALVVHYARDAEAEQIVVTPVGLVHHKPGGRRVGILWSEVAQIRPRHLRLAIEVQAADGRRRIRVGCNLQGFSQFLELVVSAMKWMDERAA